MNLIDNIYRKIKEFFKEDDLETSIMKEHNLKNESELNSYLENKSNNQVLEMIDVQLNINKSTVIEIKKVLFIEYSEDLLERIVEQISKLGIESLNFDNSNEFINTKDYLEIFIVKLVSDKNLAIAVINPYEPYQTRKIIWSHKLTK